MFRKHRRGGTALAVVALVVLGAVVAGCGSSDNGGGGGGGGKIALLLPESKTARYESQDKPKFEAKVKQLCKDCDVIYSNADQDASKQQQQADAALSNGAKVMVLDPVDAASAAGIVSRAKAQKVPVISYDRLITKGDVDYYVSFDNETVGKEQATSLSQKLGRGKTITMINGAPTDSNAALFKKGAMGVFKAQGIKIAKSYDTPDWSPDKAQQEMEQSITALGAKGFDGVYAANDGTAGGAIAAMKSNGIKPATKPTTGQDAELAGVQRVVSGEQYMTIYKAYKPEAERTAEIAVALVKGKKPNVTINQRIDNGKRKVPSVILPVQAVTKDKVKGTIIKDGLWSVSQICTKQYASACKAAGIQ